MKRVVLDASVAAKWYLPIVGEPFVDNAFRLFDAHLNREIQIEVPDLFWAEMGSVLSKALHARKLTADEVRLALDQLVDCNFSTSPSKALLRPAFHIATAFARSLFDCLYVALAESNRADLVTADEKLVNALGTRYPVKWLGTY